jgi:hypothetical protein
MLEVLLFGQDGEKFGYKLNILGLIGGLCNYKHIGLQSFVYRI